jgi:3-methyladenine DNA glycosylase AlkD
MTRADEFLRHFSEEGDDDRAAQQRAYLKSDLLFHGVSLPTIRKAAREYRAQHPQLGRADLVTLVSELWDTDYHDLRTLGIVLLQRYSTRLETEDLAFVEDLLRRSDTWDHVDGLATWIAGDICSRDSSALHTLERWSIDDNFWIRRASLLAQLTELRRGRGDFELFARFASSMIEEKEFFIRKAIGWVLREVSKKRPELSYGFLLEHIDSVSGLTLREGSKKLPTDQRDDLRRRYDSR